MVVQQVGSVWGSGPSGGYRAEKQLEVCTLTHGSLHQCVLVLAHFALQPFEHAGQLFPEAHGVGQVGSSEVSIHYLNW